jgi:hypothetical protein
MDRKSVFVDSWLAVVLCLTIDLQVKVQAEQRNPGINFQVAAPRKLIPDETPSLADLEVR